VILWRVSNYQTLDGVGGLYVSGRWHTKGYPVIYCAANPAAALLETLIHIEIDSEDRPERFHVLKIEGPDTLSQETVKADALPANWTDDFAASQDVGDRWLSEGRSVLLHVPSVLVPETWNILINPRHPQAHLLKITLTYEHPFDSRFFQ
jgi:RES domain-containing protein